MQHIAAPSFVVTGSHGGAAPPEVDIPNYVRLCRAGKLDLRPCLGQHYNLVDINQAIADMRSGGLAGRAVIRTARA
jgi:Zn-dependent alcohol dehydrogenase